MGVIRIWDPLCTAFQAKAGEQGQCYLFPKRMLDTCIVNSPASQMGQRLLAILAKRHVATHSIFPMNKRSPVHMHMPSEMLIRELNTLLAAELNENTKYAILHLGLFVLLIDVTLSGEVSKGKQGGFQLPQQNCHM